MAKFKLVVESGKERGREYPVGDAPLTIGRSSQNDITLSDELLSRHHCSVGMRGSELWITDLASVNGTQVNGRGIDDSRLSDGDKIMVGDVCISVADTEKNPSSSESGHEGLAPESSAAAAPEAKAPVVRRPLPRRRHAAVTSPVPRSAPRPCRSRPAGRRHSCRRPWRRSSGRRRRPASVSQPRGPPPRHSRPEP